MTKTLGKKLGDLRIAKNLTREKLALDLGVSKVAYGKWESDLTKPSYKNINLLCEYFQISKDELMESETPISQTNNTFNNSPNLINSTNPTITYSIPNEIIENILQNQIKFSELIASQNEIFGKVFGKGNG